MTNPTAPVYRPLLRLLLMLAAGAAGLAACDSRGTPTSATPTAVPPGYTVTGVVTTAITGGSTPVSGVFVQESRTLGGATTGEDGVYRITGVAAGSGVLRATKAGYDVFTSNLTVTDDVRVDIAVVPLATYTLSGLVFELTAMGRVAVEDVEVYCDSCGSPTGHTFAHTDAAGFYSFSWALKGIHPLLVRKAGYEVVDRVSSFPDGTGGVSASVNGDTRFDIQLARR